MRERKKFDYKIVWLKAAPGAALSGYLAAGGDLSAAYMLRADTVVKRLLRDE
jgi:hypothetical protein